MIKNGDYGLYALYSIHTPYKRKHIQAPRISKEGMEMFCNPCTNIKKIMGEKVQKRKRDSS